MKFILDGQDVLLETNGDGTTQAAYTQTPDVYGSLISQRRSGTSTFYHYDGQGSTTEITNSSGTEGWDMNSHKQSARAAFASMRRHLAVPENVRLRRESFGGIAFDKLTGTMVELDREAMAMLLRIRAEDAVPWDDLAAGFSDRDQGPPCY